MYGHFPFHTFGREMKVHEGKDSDSFLVFNIPYYSSYGLFFLEMRMEALHYVTDYLTGIV